MNNLTSETDSGCQGSAEFKSFGRTHDHGGSERLPRFLSPRRCLKPQKNSLLHGAYISKAKGRVSVSLPALLHTMGPGDALEKGFENVE
jgi:hypothetical protein